MDFELREIVKQGAQLGSRKTTERYHGYRFGAVHIGFVNSNSEKIARIEEACDLAPPIGQSLGRSDHPSRDVKHEVGWITLEEDILSRREGNFGDYCIQTMQYLRLRATTECPIPNLTTMTGNARRRRGRPDIRL
jgi:hypothetical protein